MVVKATQAVSKESLTELTEDIVWFQNLLVQKANQAFNKNGSQTHGGILPDGIAISQMDLMRNLLWRLLLTTESMLEDSKPPMTSFTPSLSSPCMTTRQGMKD